MSNRIWTAFSGDGPIVATAIHDGHEIRNELRPLFRLDELGRLREEDPYTGQWTEPFPTRVIGTHSRFQVDLNRPRDKAVYRVPDDCWGLEVWQDDLPEDVIMRSLFEYDLFYAALEELYRDLARRYGTFVVYDLHTYNHRRDGIHGPTADPAENPQVNIGTGTMKDRTRFAPVIDRLMRDLSEYDFPGGKLDVRENVKFRGGNHPRWAHETFPESACVIAIEFKKFFMNEWTGEPDSTLVEAIGQVLAATIPGVWEALGEIR